MEDRLKRPLQVGDWVLYAYASGRSALLGVGRVDRFTKNGKIGIAKKRWSSPTPSVSMYSFSDRMVAIDPMMVPEEYREFFKDWTPTEQEP